MEEGVDITTCAIEFREDLVAAYGRALQSESVPLTALSLGHAAYVPWGPEIVEIVRGLSGIRSSRAKSRVMSSVRLSRP